MMNRKSSLTTFAIFALLTVRIYALEQCEWCGVISLTDAATISTTDATFLWSQGEAETNRIDLLFVFDASARKWLSENNCVASEFVDAVIQEMNVSITLTGLGEYFMFRKAGLYDLGADLSDYSILSLNQYACGRLTNRTMEEEFIPLRQFRDDVAADIVVLLVDAKSGQYMGSSIGLTADYYAKDRIFKAAKYAYCAISISSVFSNWTVLHEVGHIFGAGHSDAQKLSPGPQLHTYSAGYYFSLNDKSYTTIMGYSTSNSSGTTRERLPFFSSPDYLLDGVPVGTTDKNDNTRTLRETYTYVANFRVKTYIPGYEPSDDDDDGGSSTVDVDDISIRIKDGLGIDIADGQTIELTQFENVDFQVAAECRSGEKATVKVTGLPTGMKFSSKTGKISGYPKKAGSFAVTVTAKAKGMATKTLKFTISAEAIPDSIVGTYAGLISSAATGDVLATATMYKTGRVTLKFRYEGANRTFSCYGFSGTADGVFSASPSMKIKKVSHVLDIAFDQSGRTLTIDGCSGKLLQNPWGRKDIGAPTFKKAIQVNAGDFTVRLYGKGKAKVAGAIGGRKVSGTFQLVAGTPEDGYLENAWSLPVAFPPKKNFAGWARMFTAKLTLDASKRVTAAIIEPGNDL